LHEPHPGNYTFAGNLDLDRFLDEAHSLGLIVLFRGGPYVCGEVNYGGLPSWLKQKHPDMKLRTNDPNYLRYVDRWWNVLYPRLKRHLYENGGPIVMVQVENEYGSYATQTNDCRQMEYLTHLRDFTREKLGKKVLLYTTDGNSIDDQRCVKLTKNNNFHQQHSLPDAVPFPMSIRQSILALNQIQPRPLPYKGSSPHGGLWSTLNFIPDG
jgi:beta-galactosidase